MASLTWHSVLRRRTLAFVGDELIWDAESADHLRSRHDRYPGGQAIEPEWTQEALGRPPRHQRLARDWGRPDVLPGRGH